tara:strand:- start:210 stop:446 length:237 start_codon:yes stop_codon:yes gene_type:complete
MKINKEVKEVSEAPIQVDIQNYFLIGSKLTNNIKVVTSWMINNGFSKMNDFKYNEATEAQIKKLKKSENGTIEIKLNK